MNTYLYTLIISLGSRISAFAEVQYDHLLGGIDAYKMMVYQVAKAGWIINGP